MAPNSIHLRRSSEYCPEHGKGESEAAAAVLAFPTRGRKRQFLSIFATQRLAKLRKDARAEFLNRMIGMTFEPDDLKVVAGILGISGRDEIPAFNHQMRTMEPGNFYAFGRSICLTPTLIKVGDVETSHEINEAKRGGRRPPPTPSKIKRLLPKLADLPKEAEEEAATLADAKHTIADLRRKLAEKTAERTASGG